MMSTKRVIDIPLIDVAALSAGDQHRREAVTQALGAACRDIGFAVITGHGIPASVIDRTRNSVIDFFSQSIQDKLTLVVSEDNYRGYIPLGFFTPNASGAADSYEGYKLHCETSASDPICRQCALYGPNKWPDYPAGFRDSVLQYWRECDRVTNLLLASLASSLDLDPHTFTQAFDKPLTNMTLLHYPPQKPDQNGFGIHAHKDTDALTILAPDPVGGLEVKARHSDHWISVDAPEDALIINIGDLLEVWSGGRFVSTPHRVINTSGQERYSFPYFAVPRHDIKVSPLVDPLTGFVRNDIPVGEVSRAIWYSNWPNAAPIDTQYDPATR